MHPELWLVRQRALHELQPSFLMKPITQDECAALKTDHCYVWKDSAYCKAHTGFFVYCDAYATDFEIGYFTLQLLRSNLSRGVALDLIGKRAFTAAMFAPVSDILISLTIRNFPQLKLSVFRRAAIRLPQLRALRLVNCSSVEIGRLDLLQFPSLRLFYALHQSTIESIEDNPFEHLQHLRHLIFEHGFNLSSPLSALLERQLCSLHCGTDYQWLRDFLERKPYLISTVHLGEVYHIGGLVNSQQTSNDTFIPVSCSKYGLVASSGSAFSSLAKEGA